jgi:hypothetical protein
VRQSGRQSGGSGSRAVAARSAVAPVVRSGGGTSGSTRPVSSRTAAIQGRGAVQARSQGRSQTIAGVIAGNTDRGDANNAKNKTVQARAGSLYNPTRVGVMGTVMSAGSRSVATRASIVTPTLFNPTAASAPSATSASEAEELAAQTDFCKAQYASCMDSFCNVLDDNQGRCSCSSSISKYEKTEEALKKATIDLQDVATKIKYLGLTRDEVLSLFTQTAAEQAMQGTSDSSALKSSLEKIQKLLIDPTSATTATSGSLSIDFNSFDFGGGFDMTSFLNEGESITNQRGAALFDTAKARCQNIISDCRKQGVDSNMVTASYDLEIDKQCIAYERSLTDANDQMKQTIRNATNVLQQARLMVSQNKNKYDLKGCVNALDACMVDDFVCGSDYVNCLDKTGQYIVNGEVVVNSQPGKNITKLPTSGSCSNNTVSYAESGIVANWNYGYDSGAKENAFNADCTNQSITGMVNKLFTEANPGSGIYGLDTGETNIAKMLYDKIGKINTTTGRAEGMCSSVLNQCQNYTFVNKDAYNEGNQVVKDYLIRTLTKIKAKQDEVLAAYGDSCRQDMISCFTKNGAVSSRPSSDLTTAIAACQPYILTCVSVTGMTDNFSEDISQYVCKGTGKLKKDGTGCET